jgi:hypothetical protein
MGDGLSNFHHPIKGEVLMRKTFSLVSRSLVSRAVLAGAAVLGLEAPLAGAARATVIYDATGGVEMGGDVIDPNAPGGVGVGPVAADRFFSPIASTLSSVTLNLKLNGPPLSGFTVDLWPDSTSTPGLPVFGMETKIASVSDSSLTSSFALYTFAPVSTIKLNPNTFYDIGVDTGTVLGEPAVTAASFGNTIDPGVLARPSVNLGAFYFHTVGGVDPNSDGPYELTVNVSVPEPSTWAMMLIGFAALGFAGRRMRRSGAPATAA